MCVCADVSFLNVCDTYADIMTKRNHNVTVPTLASLVGPLFVAQIKMMHGFL